MRKTTTNKLPALMVVALVVGSSFVSASNVSGQDKAPDRPQITITTVPPSGEGGADKTAPIAGTVKGVEFRSYRVVVYAFAANQWWVQPTTASPRTPLDRNGNWETDTHLGRRYAAALVAPSFKPKDVAPALPEEDGKQVIVIDEVAGKQ